MTDQSIIVALDKPSVDEALALLNQLDPAQCRIKIGKELFTRCGPSIVAQVQRLGFSVFLDLKFHDIPNTTAQAVHAAADLGVWMVNVHAMGGHAMLAAAADVLKQNHYATKLIAVTVLTSFSDAHLQEIGVRQSLHDHVLHLAGLAADSGLAGVVCSALEAARIHEKIGSTFLTVTPGIRLIDGYQHDQQRIVTPVQAKQLGVDYMVIGRAITQAKNPGVVLNEIYRELQINIAQ